MGEPVEPPFLRNVRIRNYKSISKCAVSFRPVTLLVGRNGSGKSNFLDALRFVTDALRSSIDSAIRQRGGIDYVCRRTAGHPHSFGIEVVVSLSDARIATYSFEIAARVEGGFAVNRETLSIDSGATARSAFFHREHSHIVSASLKNMPPVLEDRLYLVNAAGLPDFRSVYDALLAVGFYNFNPETMREPQSPEAGELLRFDGSNIASVLARLKREEPKTAGRIRTYLSTIVPAIKDFESVTVGPRETLQFSQRVEGTPHPWWFYATSMSDGTLRALGALVAVAQLGPKSSPVRLVAIEEPETALHPAAAGALMDALREASLRTQVIATTHSPDLLAEVDLERDGLLIVVSFDGTTRLATVDQASVEAVRRHLYTSGELLRLDQLQPDDRDLERQDQLELFASGATA